MLPLRVAGETGGGAGSFVLAGVVADNRAVFVAPAPPTIWSSQKTDAPTGKASPISTQNTSRTALVLKGEIR